jgi:hypothetical protein
MILRQNIESNARVYEGAGNIYQNEKGELLFKLYSTGARDRKMLEFSENEFEWNAMRGLLDYYSKLIDGGNGKVLLLAETGRKLSRERSGDKSGLSILGGAIRTLVLDPLRSKPVLVLLQQAGTRELGWSGYRFWWPILAAPGTAMPCVFATKVVAD